MRDTGLATRGGVVVERDKRLTMADMLHTSVLAPHFAPKITSGDRYCRVWISLVKWWLTQHALPRSAILTLITSWPSSVVGVLREIPETSRDNRSLAAVLDVRYMTTKEMPTAAKLMARETQSRHEKGEKGSRDLRRLFSLVVSVIGLKRIIFLLTRCRC